MSSQSITRPHPPPLGMPAAVRPPRSTLPAVYFERRSVTHREASIELRLVPGGYLRRFVVLASEKLQLALGQPRCREIDPLPAQHTHFHFRTTELWALAEHQARNSLRRLYASLAEQRLPLPTASTERAPRRQRLGRLEAIEPADKSARGQLLFAGATDDGLFCVELLEEGRRVRSITGLDLARALEVAEVTVGDMILVERDGHHELAIREEQSGTHGDGQRTIRRRRETFRITKERLSEDTSGATLMPRSLRSVSSAS